MAKDTDPGLQKQIIYSIFVRNHTPEGTFRALIPDLPRIRELGADIVWLMPIRPVGEKARKGSLGSPYANRDYRRVDPAYGSIEDFRALAEAVHENGMKLMIDVVYNHTSPDSVLWETHPEFFYKRPDGSPGNRVGDWSDIIDLDYSAPGLWDYQIESLKYWAGTVDGFRCDVASLVPLDLWKRARAEVEKVRPGCVWLAESVHSSFNSFCRMNGMYASRDADAYEAFDIEYDYDIRESFDRFLRGELPLSAWTELLNLQEQAYPANYNKLRCLENHDQPRIASLVSGEAELESFTAMQFFLKGTTLLYAGQERALKHRPSLFDKDTIDWSDGTDISPMISKLAAFKKEYLEPDDIFYAAADDASCTAVMTRQSGERVKTGIFPLRAQPSELGVRLPDGIYEDLLFGAAAEVKDGRLLCEGRPMLIVSDAVTGQV